MLYTVAIPTYNRYKLLEFSLKEITNQVKYLYDLYGYQGEILVLDDNSSDLTKELLKEYSQKFTFFRYIISDKNNGITKNRNLLTKYSTGKYILFIDSDVFITKNLIKYHLDILMNNEKIICQSNLILTNNFDNNKKFNKLTDNSNAFFDTANLSIEKKYIEQVGGFDENFSGYGWEDLEIGIRLKKIGLKQIKRNDIYAYHYQDIPNLNNLDQYIKKEVERAKGAIYFSNKYNSLEISMMTQINFISRVPLKYIYKLYGLDKNNFIKKLENIREKDYNKFIFLFRMFMNYQYLKELDKLLKQK